MKYSLEETAANFILILHLQASSQEGETNRKCPGKAHIHLPAEWLGGFHHGKKIPLRKPFETKCATEDLGQIQPRLTFVG